MGYNQREKFGLSMKGSRLLFGTILVLVLTSLGYVLACQWQILCNSRADAFVQVPEPERWNALPEDERACDRWKADWPPVKPVSAMVEMSGVVSSQMYRDIVYHIADSGNDPIIFISDMKGKLLHQIRYADSASDTEALSQGPCPWGGSCLYVADTGDNFHWRSKKRIYAIDEKSLYTTALHSAELEFQYPKQDRLDAEALAVHPLTGDMFIFSKETNRSRVFRIPAKAWQKNAGGQVAEPVGFFLYDMITDAAWSADGKRLLLINWQGVFERTGQADAEHSEREGWLPYERKIRLPTLAQQEAVAFLPDQRSIIYTSEKKLWSDSRWGIVLAHCIHGSPP